ncbi:UNVERIFIED_CONTAM: hypothetical protein GTU68_032457 [Idotea baltica]|nr:hypothetical protein [Idotea baltica]
MSVWNHPEAANLCYLGLYAQQHRGQEGAGIVSKKINEETKKTSFASHKGLGLVADIFNGFDFDNLKGSAAVGHTRYTTAGGHRLSNVQPFFAEISLGKIALCHNGNLVNADTLKRDLIKDGSIFASTSDTEVILHLLSKTEKDIPLVESIISALKLVKGAYSLSIMFEDRLYVVRDPQGLRPLCMGKLNDGLVFASETCAFDLIGAEYIRDVEPGEILEVMPDCKMNSFYPFKLSKPAPCIFEFVYFARPDSYVFGKNVYPIRKNLGVELAKESHVDADLVIPVPDSGVPSALGYAHESKLPFEYGLIRNHYVGRTFIEPEQSIRDFGVKIKLNPNVEILRGKRIVVVDDSIVRGTTSRKLVNMLRQAGAKEVHLRISSPKITDPCYYGIDTPEKSQLIAANKSEEEIREYLGVDSLAYLSIEGLYKAAGSEKGNYCDACFSGDYPIKINKKSKVEQVALFK